MEDVRNKIFYDSHGAVWITTNHSNSYIDENVHYKEEEDEKEEDEDEEEESKEIDEKRDDIYFTLCDLLPSSVDNEDVEYEEKEGIENIFCNPEENTITLRGLLSAPPKCTEIPELEIKRYMDKSEPEEVIEISESEEDEDTLSDYEVLEGNSGSEDELSISNESEEDITINIESEEDITINVESEEEDSVNKQDLVEVMGQEKEVSVVNDFIFKARRDFPGSTHSTCRPRRAKKSITKCDCCESTPYLRSRRKKTSQTSLSREYYFQLCNSKASVPEAPENSPPIGSYADNLTTINTFSKYTPHKDSLKSLVKNAHHKSKPKNTLFKDSTHKKTPPKDSSGYKLCSSIYRKTSRPSCKKKSKHPKYDLRIYKNEQEKIRREELRSQFNLLTSKVPSLLVHTVWPQITILQETLTYIKKLNFEEKLLSEEIVKLVETNSKLRRQLGIHFS